MNKKVIWTARCKSGYQYLNPRTGKYHTCNRSAGRYELLCHECHSAVVVPQVAKVSAYARMAQVVLSFFGVRLVVPTPAPALMVRTAN